MLVPQNNPAQFTPYAPQQKAAVAPDQGGGETLPTYLQQQQDGVPTVQAPKETAMDNTPAPQTQQQRTPAPQPFEPQGTSQRDQGGGETASVIPSPTEPVKATLSRAQQFSPPEEPMQAERSMASLPQFTPPAQTNSQLIPPSQPMTFTTLQAPPPAQIAQPTAPPAYTGPAAQADMPNSPFSPNAPQTSALHDAVLANGPQAAEDYWTAYFAQHNLAGRGGNVYNPAPGTPYDANAELAATKAAATPAAMKLFTDVNEKQDATNQAQNAAVQTFDDNQNRAAYGKLATAENSQQGYAGSGMNYLDPNQMPDYFVGKALAPGQGGPAAATVANPLDAAHTPTAGALHPDATFTQNGIGADAKLTQNTGLAVPSFTQAGVPVTNRTIAPGATGTDVGAGGNMPMTSGSTPTQIAGTSAGGSNANPSSVPLSQLGGFIEKLLANPSSYDDKAIQDSVANQKDTLQRAADEQMSGVDADTAARGLFFGSNNVIDKSKIRGNMQKSLTDYTTNLEQQKAAQFGQDRNSALNAAFGFLNGNQNQQSLDLQMAQLSNNIGNNGMSDIISLINGMGSGAPDFSSIDPNMLAEIGKLFASGGAGNDKRTSTAVGQPTSKLCNGVPC